MYYTLKEPYSLRGWQKLPYAITKKGSIMPMFLKRDVFDVFQLCNGRCDFDLPLFSQRQRDIAEQAVRQGLAEKSETPGTIRKEQEYVCYPARFIRTAHWSITGRCNYNCRHCCMSASEGKMGELPHDVMLHLVEELAHCGVRSVSLTGGEPLVRSDFWEIVDALLERDIIITTIYSNGFLVNDAFLDGLERRGIHCEINMSFDGVGHHDWLRGVEGAERYANDAFRRCQQRGFPTAAEMCIHAGNRDTLRETVNHLAALGCTSLKTNPVSDLGSWTANGYGESISVTELYRTYLAYIPYFFADGAPLDLQLGGFFYGEKGNRESYLRPLDRSCEDPEKVCLCNHARNVLYISPEGRALPCFSLSGMEVQQTYPLITRMGLEQCLTDSTYLELVQTKAAEVIRHNEKCAGCEYRNACMGGCRAGAMEQNQQDPLGIDPYCCEYYTGGWSEKVKAVAEAAIAQCKD